MTATLLYLGDLRTEATHQASGAKIISDAPKDNQGNGAAFSPTDLTCSSLAACMMTIMGIAARTHDINIKGSTVQLQKTMAADPRRISKIELHFAMQGQEEFSPKQRAILENAAVTCPVAKSLHPDIEQAVSFEWG